MPEKDTNIYKTARKKAGLTQEKAAECLGISVESIKAYERYERIPPSHVVDLMCVVYDALYLAYQHTRIISGDVKVVPEVRVLDLQSATLQLINRVLDFSEQRHDRTLMKIAEDGVIDERERPMFDEIMGLLEEIVQAAIEIRVSEETNRN